MKIAVSGPDGSGKTSVCKLLSEKLHAKKIVYAGKRGFQLKTTSWAFNVWSFLNKFGSLGGFFGLYFFYYPFEYFENCFRFTRSVDVDDILIFDRHPIDRVMFYHEFLFNKGVKSAGFKFRIEAVFRFIISRIYLNFFPKINRIYILLPDTKCFFERSEGQYSSMMHAQIRSDAYKTAAKEWKDCECVVLVRFDDKFSIEEIVDYIIEDLGLADDA